MSSRSERRHHLERVKVKRYREEKRRHMPVEQWAVRNANLRTHTGTMCSCWMCGNPRRFRGNSRSALTMQELRNPFELE